MQASHLVYIDTYASVNKIEAALSHVVEITKFINYIVRISGNTCRKCPYPVDL